MTDSMRIMSKTPRNAETPNDYLRSWITANAVFFDRNQGQIPEHEVALSEWKMNVDGEVLNPLVIDFDSLLQLPKAIAANTLECSGNSRSLLEKKSFGNPWTIGGVGNAVWGGVWLKDILEKAGLTAKAKHVAFEGFDTPLGKAQIKFIRSIPLEKALSSTLLAYEMNGDPLPNKHGFPLRALALGWTGANCVKWLNRITVLEAPHEGFYMDDVYRVFQPGEDPKSGEAVTTLSLKSIITQPVVDEQLPLGDVVVLGAAYAGEEDIAMVEISVDDGSNWQPVEFIGPHEKYAWRQWQFIWQPEIAGDYTILARATTQSGRQQPMQASWNKLGYGNNGVREHGVTCTIT